jgi:hypothetical protein
LQQLAGDVATDCITSSAFRSDPKLKPIWVKRVSIAVFQNGCTALHYAASGDSEQHLQIVGVLLKAGAKADEADKVSVL